MQTKTTIHGKIQANIKKLVNLIGSRLYSTSEIVIRELTQNAYDSIVMRHGKAFCDLGNIEFRTSSGGTVEITDNGMGMDEDGLVNFLSTMGETVKTEDTDNEYIGKFGLGFFSSFMIADTIIVETRMENKPAYRWSSTGVENYSIDELTEEIPVGTRITLVLQRGSFAFADPVRLKSVIRKYCNFLNCPIFCNHERTNAGKFPWEWRDKAKFAAALERYYEKPVTLFKHFSDAQNKFDCVLCLIDTHAEIEVYSKNIFVTNKLTQVLPEELKFMRTLVNCNDLELTLSREDIQSSPAWRSLTGSIKEMALKWIEELALKHPDDEFMKNIIRNNQNKFKEAALKSNPLFNSIYNLITLPLSNWGKPSVKVTIHSYKSFCKQFHSKVYFHEPAANAKLSSLLNILKRKGIPVFEPENPMEMELLRKIANKISADLVNIEYQGDSLLEEFRSTDANNLAAYYTTVLSQPVKLKQIDPEWVPLIPVNNVIYLNTKNPFLNELDNLTLNAEHKRSLYVNFLRTFTAMAESVDHLGSNGPRLSKEIIHLFHNWINDLSQLEATSAKLDTLNHWWGDPISIHSLRSDGPFKIKGVDYHYRCFIACPFSAKYRDVSNQIKGTFRSRKIWADTAEHVDNISILRKICAQIDQCHFAIVDVSESNPNVMLELGLLIARRKPAIIIRQSNSDIHQEIKIPADIISIERIEYTNTTEDLAAKLADIADRLTKDHHA